LPYNGSVRIWPSESTRTRPRCSITDILVRLEHPQIAPLMSALGSAFYADADAIERAVARHGSVNVIHIATSIKVDLFVAGASPLDAPG
jgi:hypothetical protein